MTLLLTLKPEQLKAEEEEVVKVYKESRYQSHTILYITAGIPWGETADDFFEIYQKNLGGKKREFEISPLVGAGLKMHLINKFRIGLSLEYFRNWFTESIDQKIFEPSVYRHLNEEITVETAPVLVSIEYIPYSHKQFKSYAGLGSGVNIGRTSWEEKVNSDLKIDLRTGGNLYNEIDISPAFRALGGVELGFDKAVGQYFIGSLIFEIRYTYMLRNIDLFKEIRQQYKTEPEDFANKVEMIRSYISLNTAVSFNLRKLLPK